MRQKLLVLLLALMLAFGSLTACGGEGGDDNIPSEGQTDGGGDGGEGGQEAEDD
jgi:predicted small lipoprotein YifL